MEEEIEGNGGIQQHTTGANNAEGRDAQQTMQDQEHDQRRVDRDKDHRQCRLNKPFSGHARHRESDH